MTGRRHGGGVGSGGVVVPVDVGSATALIPVTQELLDDAVVFDLPGIWARWEAERRAFAALPAEEQARILAEREAEAEARRLEREAQRCPSCGCHPDEHGDGGW